jgi:hypothetical protein
MNNDGNGDFYKNNKTGFESTAFIKENTVAVVIRGMHLKSFTVNGFFKDKDGKSAGSIFFGNMGIPFVGSVPKQFDDAQNLYKMIKTKFPKHKIVLVGKSLGGGLAELLGAIYGDDTYTFASPGMAYALPKLSKDLRAKILKNSSTGFQYIKTYHNFNDPCGSYGKHLGLTFIYPPIKNYRNFFNDVHGNIKNFASPDALSKIRAIPKEWKPCYTAAIIYYDPNFKEKKGIFSLHDYIKIRYKVKVEDFFEAERFVNKTFGEPDQNTTQIGIIGQKANIN